MEYDSIHENLKKLLTESGGKFNIMEEQIDVDLQVEFFELVNVKLKDKESESNLEKAEDKLFRKEASEDEIRGLLVELSNSKQVEHYRLIEKFIQKAEGEIRSWAILALQHARIGLESELLDEQQVFISTGLGGQGEDLRYFFAGKLKNEKQFTESQKKIIRNEFEHCFNEQDSKVEQINYTNEYFTVIALIPIQKPISDVITKAISEVNNFGDFLFDEYLVTNVKVLVEKEIEGYFKKKGI